MKSPKKKKAFTKLLSHTNKQTGLFETITAQILKAQRYYLQIAPLEKKFGTKKVSILKYLHYFKYLLLEKKFGTKKVSVLKYLHYFIQTLESTFSTSDYSQTFSRINRERIKKKKNSLWSPLEQSFKALSRDQCYHLLLHLSDNSSSRMFLSCPYAPLLMVSDGLIHLVLTLLASGDGPSSISKHPYQQKMNTKSI